MTKRTNKEMFIALLSVITKAEISETDRVEMTNFINGRIEQIDRKANTVTKADREKAELNARIAQDVLDGLNFVDKPIKVSELIKAYEPLNGLSTQKLTPIMTTLVNDGKIEKAVVKRETLYSIKIA